MTRALSLLLFLALLTLPTRAADPTLIQGGQGVGPIRLGQSQPEVERALGRPSSVQASPNDPDSRLLGFASKGLAVFVGSSGGVIGITVMGTGYRTAEGIRVGSPEAKVQQVYGAGLQRGPGNFTYPARGLGFSFASGKVTQIYVVQREDQRALLGDRIIVAGRRVGDVRIGDPISKVEEAWGRADKVLPLGQGSKRNLHRYKEEALGLIVYGGRIEGMILETGDFITPDGIKVGSSRAEVLKAFGRTNRTEPERLWYDVRGIGFWFQGDRVRQIQVVEGKK